MLSLDRGSVGKVPGEGEKRPYRSRAISPV